MADAEFSGFEIRKIQQLAGDPSLFFGVVELKFKEEIDDVDVGYTLSVRVRVSHSAEATFASLREKLFDQARDLLSQAGRLVAQETAESLYQQDVEMKRQWRERAGLV